jgi:hypothetical protein
MVVLGAGGLVVEGEAAAATPRHHARLHQRHEARAAKRKHRKHRKKHRRHKSSPPPAQEM